MALQPHPSLAPVRLAFRSWSRSSAAASDGSARLSTFTVKPADAQQWPQFDPRLAPRLRAIVRGWSGHPDEMMVGIDAGFAAAIDTGYHSKAGTESIRSPTLPICASRGCGRLRRAFGLPRWRRRNLCGGAGHGGGPCDGGNAGRKGACIDVHLARLIRRLIRSGHRVQHAKRSLSRKLDTMRH